LVIAAPHDSPIGARVRHLAEKGRDCESRTEEICQKVQPLNLSKANAQQIEPLIRGLSKISGELVEYSKSKETIKKEMASG